MTSPQTPSSPTPSLDAELEAVFDTPDSPTLSPDRQVPPSPPPPPKRTILTALLERKESLTGQAAQIAAEVSALSKAVSTPRLPISQAMMQRRLSKAEPSPAEKERLEKQRARHAKNAFKAVGKQVTSARKQGYQYVDDRFANMALKDAVFDEKSMEAIFEHSLRVDVSEIRSKDEELRSGRIIEFVIFGCLVRKHSKKESKNGSKYAVWSLCNMPRGRLQSGETPEPTVVTVLLFEEAFASFHTQTEGSVFALRKPNLLPPRGAGSDLASDSGHAKFSGHCLRVSKKDQLIFLGICKDYQLCEAGGPNLSVCGTWYDANRMTQCPRHALARRKRMTAGSRMDVNNAERPGMPYKSAITNIQAPLDISIPQAFSRSKYGNEDNADADVLIEEEARRKKKKEKETIDKLLKRGRVSHSAQNARNLLVKRPRLVPQHTRKDIRNIIMKEQTSAEAGKKNNGGSREKNGSLQQRCDAAIEVLLDCGYVLHEDGSLTPPVRGRRIGLIAVTGDATKNGRKMQITDRTEKKDRVKETDGRLGKNGGKEMDATTRVYESKNDRKPGGCEGVEEMTIGNEKGEREGLKAGIGKQSGTEIEKGGEEEVMELSDESEEED